MTEPQTTSSRLVLSFWKMHGLGNDYVLVDNRDERIREEELGKAAQKLCERRFSVGADGLLLLYSSHVADAKMRIFNADGSEAEMCGNGIRCFAKFCYENGVADKKELAVETNAGIRRTWLKTRGGKVKDVTVDMGSPVFEREHVPVAGKGRCVSEELGVDGETFRITCLSVGNPHCVIFVDDVDAFPVERFGPKIETHPLFPNRINVEFVQVIARDQVKVRVWERGVGETLACGTGACASFAAANLLGKIGNTCTVHLSGGDLDIEYADDRLHMTGTAKKSFEGIVELEVSH